MFLLLSLLLLLLQLVRVFGFVADVAAVASIRVYRSQFYFTEITKLPTTNLFGWSLLRVCVCARLFGFSQFVLMAQQQHQRQKQDSLFCSPISEVF